MFEGLHNGQRDLAKRAGVALAIRHLLESRTVIPHEMLGNAAHELIGVPVGLLSSSSPRWTHYAGAVERSIRENSAQTVNDRWGDRYTGDVILAAERVADILVAAVRPLPVTR